MNIKQTLTGKVLFFVSLILISSPLPCMEQDKSALFNAIENNDLLKVETLITQRPNLVNVQYPVPGYRGLGTPLHVAVHFNDKAIVELLLHHNANVNAKDSQGATPLGQACINGNSDIVELLLKKGADIHARNFSMVTPLHCATINNRTNIVKLLLAHKEKPDVNAEDPRQVTPLHYAVLSGRNIEMVKLLLDHGANVNVLDNGKNSPLHNAVSSGITLIVKILLEHNADTNLKNREGETPLDIASEGKDKSSIEITQLLKDWPYYQTYKTRLIRNFMLSLKELNLENILNADEYKNIINLTKKGWTLDTPETIHKKAEQERIAEENIKQTK